MQRKPLLTLLAVAALLLLPAATTVSASGGPGRHFMPTVSVANATPRGLFIPGNMINHGGPVQAAPKVYLVFWGWHSTTGLPYGVDPYGEAPYLVNFFNGVGGSHWAGVQTQYSGITNPTGQLAGVWVDDSGAYDPTAEGGFGPTYIANEALRAAAHFGYSANADYMIALPPGADLQDRLLDGYCAWHSYVDDASSRAVAYTNLPYVPDMGPDCGMFWVNPPVLPIGACAFTLQCTPNTGASANTNVGLLDGVSIVAGHEYAEALTDPQLNAWYDASGWENGDKCAWDTTGPGAMQNIVLSTGTFAVQGLWSNAVSNCAV